MGFKSFGVTICELIEPSLLDITSYVSFNHTNNNYTISTSHETGSYIDANTLFSGAVILPITSNANLNISSTSS